MYDAGDVLRSQYTFVNTNSKARRPQKITTVGITLGNSTLHLIILDGKRCIRAFQWNAQTNNALAHVSRETHRLGSLSTCNFILIL